jgi:protease-4
MMGLVFLLVISVIVNPNVSEMGLETAANDKSWDLQTYREGDTEQGKLAVLSINGIIQGGNTGLSDTDVYNHEVFLNELEDAFSDPNTRGVLIRVNSPGGGVYESTEVYSKISTLKEKYKKPYVVYMEQLAASGGYYVSLPADAIYANQNTLTGSIGVIISTINYNKLAENLGVEEVVFKSGPNKDMLNPMREMTPEEAAIMKSITDESYQDFLQAFMKEREIGREEALKLADGRIYTARQAKAASIIDEIGSLDQAIDGLAKLANLKKPKVIEYKNKPLTPYEKLIGLAELGPNLSGLGARLGLGLDTLNKQEYAASSPYPQAMYVCNWNY